jgi:membrane protein
MASHESGKEHEPSQAAEPGREAEKPTQLGAGWKDVLRRVRAEATQDNLDMIAGGVAFYAFLALFPAIAAVVSVYGLVADPEAAVQQVRDATAGAPEDVRAMLIEQVERLSAQSSGTLGFSTMLTLLLTLWSANKGMKGLLTALNIAYGEPDERGFLAKNAKSFALTVGATVSVVVLLGLLVGLPPLLGYLGLGKVATITLQVLRWPLIAAWVLFGLAVIYRFGPHRENPQWRWVTPGSLAATVLWLFASVVFAVYAANFGNYNATYGSLGAVVILLFWLYLSAYVVLLGAEINAEAEHQTRKDTTRGPPRPLGKRGAYAADTLGS